MAFVRRRRSDSDQVRLEVQIVNGDICASISAPASSGYCLYLDRVPIKRAVVLAACLAERFGKDVAVVDRHGLWPG